MSKPPDQKLMYYKCKHNVSYSAVPLLLLRFHKVFAKDMYFPMEKAVHLFNPHVIIELYFVCPWNPASLSTRKVSPHAHQKKKGWSWDGISKSNA